MLPIVLEVLEKKKKSTCCCVGFTVVFEGSGNVLLKDYDQLVIGENQFSFSVGLFSKP